MKIAQITTVFPPFRGGMSQVPYQHARGLYKLGYEVDVLTPDYGFGTITEEFNIIYIKPWLKWGLGAFCPQIFSQLKKYDVIELHYPAFGMAIVVALAKLFRATQAKLVLFYHMDNFGAGLFQIIYPLYNIFFRPFIIRQADVILASSFDYIQHSGIKKFYNKYPNRFQELPFGVTAEFKPQDRNNDLLQQFNIQPDKKIILFLGGLGPEHYFKGINVLLQAVSRLQTDNWHLVCVGRGSLIPQYQQQARDLNISDRVTFTDYQPDEVKPDWYNLATVTVLPSTDRSEAFGIMLVEAMACGSPVIASDLPGVRTVVENYINGLLFQSGDATDLANKINQILTTTDLQQKFRHNAVQIAQDKYQWGKIIDKLDVIIKE